MACFGFDTFGIKLITVVFYWHGMTPPAKNSCVPQVQQIQGLHVIENTPILHPVW